MRNSWSRLFRRLAFASTISGASAWTSAVCYAVQVAFDTPDDAPYANGWQAGDNGGFGFGPWNFDGTVTNSPIPNSPDLPDGGNQQAIDNGMQAGTTGSSPHNNIGRAWTMFNKNGPNTNGFGSPTGPDNPPSGGTELSESGRAILGGLQVGSTVKVVIDNPTERRFFRGMTVKLNHGGANECYSGDNCTTLAYDPGSITVRAAVGTFEYFTYGQWYATGGGAAPNLFDTDTDAGMSIEFTLLTANTYILLVLNLLP